MTNYPTDVHQPGNQARTQTQEYAICQVCGVQWQIKSPNRDDAKGCSFCDAPEQAITIVSEAPGYEGGLIQ